ncbi:hypothetical protein AAFF_G00106510 [Aldrovandia affinis]|uniref:EF-hand domain-containing protein n=1 Tax=Aldrovandia affinis TaxID=143900 RepID=A0AAD7WYP8_9TELE|nr:hypothetical protein AAFF_G00106510 [Aldrovandia affinis]
MGQSQSEVDSEVHLGEIQKLYSKFATECPSGNLHLHEFKRILGVSSKSSVEESAYLDSVFRSLDTNEDNTIDFLEYVAAVHIILRGKLEDKLRWSFKVYDSDGNGLLDKNEVRYIIKIIAGIREHSGHMSDSLSPEQICDQIFDLVDKNNDGQISFEEFLEGAQKDQWVLDHLKLDVKPSAWLLEQQRKSKFYKRLRETVKAMTRTEPQLDSTAPELTSLNEMHITTQMSSTSKCDGAHSQLNGQAEDPWMNISKKALA